MKPALGLLLLVLAPASPEIRYFQYQRQVLNTHHTGQTCLALDAEIMAHAAPQLADLRLYNNTLEVPWVLRIAASYETAEKSITPLNLGLRAGNTVFDTAIQNGPYGEGSYSDLQLDIAAQDFIATVTISGSHTQNVNAATKPDTILGSYTIFDLSHQRLGRSTILHLPKSDFPFLHFEIAGPIKPENVTGISVSQLPANPPRYETIAQSSHVTQKGHSSVLEFSVPAHVPVDRISFSPIAQPAAFSRNVSISASAQTATPANDRAPGAYPVKTSGNILRLHANRNGHRLDEERLSIDASPADFNAAQKWTVTIDNGDDAPLSFESVSLQMVERTLCFESVQNANFALYYGDPALTAPQYDYATLFTPQTDAQRATAGPEQRNPRYQPRPDDRPFSEKHPALLWAALVLVVVLLGIIALRSAKRANPASQ